MMPRYNTVVLLFFTLNTSDLRIDKRNQFLFLREKSKTSHSALKLEKSAISKVQKHIFYYFKNGKKSIFAQEKSLKLPKRQF